MSKISIHQMRTVLTSKLSDSKFKKYTVTSEFSAVITSQVLEYQNSE